MPNVEIKCWIFAPRIGVTCRREVDERVLKYSEFAAQSTNSYLVPHLGSRCFFVIQVRRETERFATNTACFYPSPVAFDMLATCVDRFLESEQSDSRVSAMVLRSSGEDHEAASSPYRHVEADTPKSVISADRFLVACGTRPVR